jgi:polyvinyl alcohol dehydrogenase (cytochrome)
MKGRSPFPHNAGVFAAVIANLVLLTAVLAPSLATAQSWPIAGHDLSDTRSQPNETTISPANVSQLAPRWVFTTHGDVSATPTVSGGVAFFPDWGGYLYAVRAGNGKLIWSHSISDYNGQVSAMSRISPAVYQGELIIGDNVSQAIEHNGAHIMAVDGKTGKLLWITQVDPHPAAIITGSPVVSGGTVYVGVSSNEEALATNNSYPCCTHRGSMVALSARTGQILWQTYTIPDNGGQTGGYSGNAIWGPVALGNGTLFTATGNNYTVPASVAQCEAQGGTNCESPDDYFDSALALDPATGAIKWAHKLWGPDAWTVACTTGGSNCPSPTGPDYDFGSGPNFMGNLVGFGQKSGIYWALNPSNGNIVWATSVGPGGTLGGLEWGSATDGSRLYAAIGNNGMTPYALANGGPTISWGSWAALDAQTGSFIWQIADPTPGSIDVGSVSVANGVVYTDSYSGYVYAINAATGAILWSFNTGGSVIDGPSIVKGFVFWGSGFRHIAPGIGNNKVYAFTIPGTVF